MSDYEVHLCPPKYPAQCHPWRCRHEPQFVMQANVEIVKRKRGGSIVEVDHAVCLACGKSMASTYGGNVLVDLQMLYSRFGWHAQIGGRVIELRNKWSRIATYLFGPKGWNGKHEKLARLIDPNLTMKIKLRRVGKRRRFTQQTIRMGTIAFDQSYLRPAGAA